MQTLVTDSSDVCIYTRDRQLKTSHGSLTKLHRGRVPQPQECNVETKWDAYLETTFLNLYDDVLSHMGDRHIMFHKGSNISMKKYKDNSYDH